MRLNFGAGTHYAPGWVNLDVRSDHHTRADVVVDSAAPFATFPDDSIDAIYFGHVLEHVPWPRVVGLLEDARRVLTPGAPVLVVGPDVHRTIRAWAQGSEPWWLVDSVLEHAHRASGDWPEAVHWWNCTESRLVEALDASGFAEVVPTVDFDGWPVVGWSSSWQCAVRAAA